MAGATLVAGSMTVLLFMSNNHLMTAFVGRAVVLLALRRVEYDPTGTPGTLTLTRLLAEHYCQLHS